MWKYKGDVISMVDNIQWAFVVETMMHKDKRRLKQIMSDNDSMRKAAEEYGMTRMAVAKEMVRLGRKAILLLNESDEEQE